MTRAALAIVFAMLSSTASAHKAIFLVRHAEKASATDPDSPISVSGEDRALALARLLRNARVTHVFVSDKKRTVQTAEALSESYDLKPIVTPAVDTKALIEKLKAVPKDAVVVVVGHSDTVPDVLAGLGVAAKIVIKEDQYGRVFLVGGDNNLVELAY
ncbi:MAG: histidine phosphatase family protein [Deltaproteobacteria bacterium]|nr:histidine phosphatase family protein [Deltaproteobacteria bacterium]